MTSLSDTPSDAAGAAFNVTVRPNSVLLLSGDPGLSSQLARAGFDPTLAPTGFLAGLHFGRKRFDCALLDADAEGFKAVWQWLRHHATFLPCGVLTPEDRPPAGEPLHWQKPADAAQVAAGLLADLRARRAAS